MSKIKNKKIISLFALLGVLLTNYAYLAQTTTTEDDTTYQNSTIKWVDFDIPHNALSYAMEIDLNSGGILNWIEILSIAAVWYDGDWTRYKSSDIDSIHTQLKHDNAIAVSGSEEIYNYYYKSYHAVLGGWLSVEQTVEENGVVMPLYGISVSTPISSEYSPTHEPDFGASRSFGYDRKHLGNDIMAEEGTPIFAIESGVVTALGWNSYGGWRIGIESHDGKRYYYYAHMMKDTPYAPGIYQGKEVSAGEVIGYVGNTGYSDTENESNIELPHLHIGLRLIFDENTSQHSPEIWVDMYALIELLMNIDKQT